MASRPTLLHRIASFNRGRDPERLALKYKAMQKNALAFFRGTCHLFYEDWPLAHPLNEAPCVWVCGDLHLENFGTYRGDNRLVYFDIADFDEALLAPCTWDLARLVASALIAARVHGLKRKRARALGEAFLGAYAAALRDGKARWIERALARGLVGRTLQALEKGNRRTFVKARTVPRSGGRKLRIDGEHTLAISGADEKRVRKFMREFARGQTDPEFFKVLDVARRIAGTGSLGLERYTILVRGRGSPSGRVLLDLKRATPSALRPYAPIRQPPWKSEADRVVEVQRRAQAIAPALLCAVTVASRPFVLRELMPTQDKLDLDAMGGQGDLLDPLARDLGALVAWGALRSGGRDGSATIDELADFARRRRWPRSLLDYAEAYQQTAWDDWKQFREAYQDNALP